MTEQFRKTAIQVLSILLLLMVSATLYVAWRSYRPAQRSQEPEPLPAIEPLFKEFYAALGGKPVLGDPLAGGFQQGAMRCQYVEAALMCFDPAQVDPNLRYSLFPLGLQLGADRLDPASESGEIPAVDPAFADLYAQISGSQFAGQALTSLYVNEPLGRSEQYFENIAFARPLAGESAPPTLLPLGAWLCGVDCSQDLESFWQLRQEILAVAWNTDPAEVFTPAMLTLHTEVRSARQNEKYPPYIIQASVVWQADGKPLYLVPAHAVLTAPGYPAQVWPLPPTDQDGRSSVLIRLPTGLAPESMVSYQLCLDLPGPSPVCSESSFVYRLDGKLP